MQAANRWAMASAMLAVAAGAAHWLPPPLPAQNITTVQDDPRKQALAWGRYAGKAFAGTGGV